MFERLLDLAREFLAVRFIERIIPYANSSKPLGSIQLNAAVAN
jgi:hypothetical protein